MFWLAAVIQRYLTQFVNWLLLTAFAVDQLSTLLLRAAKRHCQRWLPLTRLTVNRKGRILKFGVKKHGIRL